MRFVFIFRCFLASFMILFCLDLCARWCMKMCSCFSSSYSCGSCGYALNLSSSNRNISTVGSKYGKSIKRGIISFFYIDDSRFTQVDEIECLPHFSKHSWGLFRQRIKLLCRKCNNHIGIAYDECTSSHPVPSEESDSSSGQHVSKRRKYDIKIRALQPSSSEETAL